MTSHSSPQFLARFDRRVPRYTSYPTAPHFHPGVGAALYRDWLAGLAPGTAVSLYLHVPFCREMCWYCGCHTQVVRRHQPIADYVALLLREIDLVADAIGSRLDVRHIHWGGGTPNLLAMDEIAAIWQKLNHCFAVAADADVAMEIDPRSLRPDQAASLVACGINRASLGVQDFAPAVQVAVNRIQSFACTAAATEDLRRAGVRGINFDLMYGLPLQTIAGLVDTVEQALGLRPNRIALFGYAHVPWLKKHQQLIHDDELPDAGQRIAQYQEASALIAAHGYRRVGLDHFAAPGDALTRQSIAGRLRRNFQGYTTDEAPVLLGLGVSAIGTMAPGYVQNTPSIIDYRAALAQGDLATARGRALTDDDRLRRDIIERVMCDLEVDIAEMCRRHGVAPAALAPELAAIDRLAADGLTRRDEWRVSVPKAARPLVRLVAAAFDAYLAGDVAAARAPRHAHAI